MPSEEFDRGMSSQVGDDPDVQRLMDDLRHELEQSEGDKRQLQRRVDRLEKRPVAAQRREREGILSKIGLGLSGLALAISLLAGGAAVADQGQPDVVVQPPGMTQVESSGQVLDEVSGGQSLAEGDLVDAMQEFQRVFTLYSVDNATGEEVAEAFRAIVEASRDELGNIDEERLEQLAKFVEVLSELGVGASLPQLPNEQPTQAP